MITNGELNFFIHRRSIIKYIIQTGTQTIMYRIPFLYTVYKWLMKEFKIFKEEQTHPLNKKYDLKEDCCWWYYLRYILWKFH